MAVGVVVTALTVVTDVVLVATEDVVAVICGISSTVVDAASKNVRPIVENEGAGVG